VVETRTVRKYPTTARVDTQWHDVDLNDSFKRGEFFEAVAEGKEAALLIFIQSTYFAEELARRLAVDCG